MSEVTLSLRINKKVVDKLDKYLKPIKMPKTTWMFEAMREKFERDTGKRLLETEEKKEK